MRAALRFDPPRGALLGPARLALSLALAACAILAAAPAAADCEETASAAERAMDASIERQELLDPFPSADAAYQAWSGCLEGLTGYPVALGLELGPLPDFGDIVESLCRRTRQKALEVIRKKTSFYGQAKGGNKALASPALADELERALK